jgi:hypothetical protein
MNMNTQDIELDVLSDDELNEVAGGERNLMNLTVQTCLAAFLGAAGQAGADYFVSKVQICA